MKSFLSLPSTEVGKLSVTVIFLSFRTDRSTQPSLIRVYTVCNSLCIFWMHYSKETPPCSAFRVITINFRVSEILGFLWYWRKDVHYLYLALVLTT